MADEQDVIAEPSSALEGAIASSPEALEEPQGTETDSATTESQEQEQTEEEGKIPYSRFKEKVDETNWYKQQMETLLQRQQAQQPQQPTQPQEMGSTPEEREFWKAIDKRAEAIAEQKLRQISPVIDAGRMELAQMKVQQFRVAHPDVKSNSAEEIAIAERIQSGYLPEDAYKVVMWDRKFAQSEKQANTNKQVKLEAKKQANVEQKSIPSGVNSHIKETLSVKERIKREADKLDWS